MKRLRAGPGYNLRHWMPGNLFFPDSQLLAEEGGDLAHPLGQGGELGRGDGLRAVRKGMGRIVVHLNDEAVGPSGNRGQSQGCLLYTSRCV